MLKGLNLHEITSQSQLSRLASYFRTPQGWDSCVLTTHLLHLHSKAFTNVKKKRFEKSRTKEKNFFKHIERKIFKRCTKDEVSSFLKVWHGRFAKKFFKSRKWLPLYGPKTDLTWITNIDVLYYWTEKSEAIAYNIAKNSPTNQPTNHSINLIFLVFRGGLMVTRLVDEQRGKGSIWVEIKRRFFTKALFES